MTKNQIEIIPHGPYQGLWLGIETGVVVLLTAEIPSEHKTDKTKTLEQRRNGII